MKIIAKMNYNRFYLKAVYQVLSNKCQMALNIVLAKMEITCPAVKNRELP